MIVDGGDLSTARRADGVEDEDGEEGSANSGEGDTATSKMQVNHKSTCSWCHHLPKHCYRHGEGLGSALRGRSPSNRKGRQQESPRERQQESGCNRPS